MPVGPKHLLGIKPPWVQSSQPAAEPCFYVPNTLGQKPLQEAKPCLCVQAPQEPKSLLGSKPYSRARNLCEVQIPSRAKPVCVSPNPTGLKSTLGSKLCLWIPNPWWVPNPLRLPNQFWGPRCACGSQTPCRDRNSVQDPNPLQGPNRPAAPELPAGARSVSGSQPLWSLHPLKHPLGVSACLGVPNPCEL